MFFEFRVWPALSSLTGVLSLGLCRRAGFKLFKVLGPFQHEGARSSSESRWRLRMSFAVEGARIIGSGSLVAVLAGGVCPVTSFEFSTLVVGLEFRLDVFRPVACHHVSVNTHACGHSLFS